MYIFLLQLKLNKEDFAQERSDRASAAGRYAEKEEKLEKTIQNLQNELEFLKSSRQVSKCSLKR